MFLNLRRIRKQQLAHLLTAGLLLSLMTVCWDQLDHHVVSHMRSFSYRYLVNSYDFLNSSFAAGANRAGAGPPRYLINNPQKCGGGLEDVLLLLFVKSSPENFEQRRSIRDTWGNEAFLRSRLAANVKVLFALGTPPHAGGRGRRVQAALVREDRIHGDLVQQDFEDTFHNLTRKLLLQFHWGHVFCPQASFLMTADDDVFVHTPNLLRYLRRSAAGGLWAGHVHRGAPPVRRKDSKYFVPHELYPWPAYPDYTAGAGYVVSGDVAAKIYGAALLLHPSMYIDDVFMGICAQAAGVSPRDHAHFSGEGKAPDHPCIYEHMITSHGHGADMRALWRAAAGAGADAGHRGILGNVYCKAVRAMLLCLPYYRNTFPCRAALT